MPIFVRYTIFSTFFFKIKDCNELVRNKVIFILWLLLTKYNRNSFSVLGHQSFGGGGIQTKNDLTMCVLFMQWVQRTHKNKFVVCCVKRRVCDYCHYIEIWCQVNVKYYVSKGWMTRSELNSDLNLWKFMLKWLWYIGRKARSSIAGPTSACCQETPTASRLWGITLLNLNELMACAGPQDLCRYSLHALCKWVLRAGRVTCQSIIRSHY
jgi:hypothetical protein